MAHDDLRRHLPYFLLAGGGLVVTGIRLPWRNPSCEKGATDSRRLLQASESQLHLQPNARSAVRAERGGGCAVATSRFRSMTLPIGGRLEGARLC